MKTIALFLLRKNGLTFLQEVKLARQRYQYKKDKLIAIAVS